MIRRCLVLWVLGNLKGFKMTLYLYKPHKGKIIQPQGIDGKIKVLKILDKCANKMK